MYELTASEAATVLAILSKDGGPDSAVEGPTKIPTSTFYATRRKAYEAGWLSDRYVPHPWAIGLRGIDCLLVRPSPADRGRLERELTAQAGDVILWSGPNVLFGVSFRAHDESLRVENGTTISVTPSSGSIPVYFDYSRPWSRFIRVERETGYPRPLAERLDRPERRPSPVLSGLVLQDRAEGTAPPSARRWHSPSELSRMEQRALQRGEVRSRTFLNLDSLPPYDGRALGEIIILTGELRKGASSTEVLRGLDGQCQVSPVFMADDATNLILIALGQVSVSELKRTRLPRATGPVASTLDASLKDLHVVVEHADNVRKIVDHRYDRLFPASHVGSPHHLPGPRWTPPRLRSADLRATSRAPAGLGSRLPCPSWSSSGSGRLDRIEGAPPGDRSPSPGPPRRLREGGDGPGVGEVDLDRTRSRIPARPTRRSRWGGTFPRPASAGLDAALTLCRPSVG